MGWHVLAVTDGPPDETEVVCYAVSFTPDHDCVPEGFLAKGLSGPKLMTEDSELAALVASTLNLAMGMADAYVLTDARRSGDE